MNLVTRLLSKNKKIQIDFCQKNLYIFLTEKSFSSYDSFLSRKDILYKEYDCQSRCEECKKSPYAIVNGEFISAESSAELLEKLKQLASKQ